MTPPVGCAGKSKLLKRANKRKIFLPLALILFIHYLCFLVSVFLLLIHSSWCAALRWPVNTLAGIALCLRPTLKTTSLLTSLQLISTFAFLLQFTTWRHATFSDLLASLWQAMFPGIQPPSRLSLARPIIQFNLEAAPEAPGDMAPAVYQATFYKLSEKPWLTLHLAHDKKPLSA